MTAPVIPEAEQREASGVVLDVDAVARELTLLAGGQLLELYVPPDCEVRLNGELVRLRLIQPSDRLRVSYDPGPRQGSARRVSVEAAEGRHD
jgi:hypothetical protein